jgi:hypothetical protein
VSQLESEVALLRARLDRLESVPGVPEYGLTCENG